MSSDEGGIDAVGVENIPSASQEDKEEYQKGQYIFLRKAQGQNKVSNGMTESEFRISER